MAHKQQWTAEIFYPCAGSETHQIQATGEHDARQQAEQLTDRPVFSWHDTVYQRQEWAAAREIHIGTLDAQDGGGQIQLWQDDPILDDILNPDDPSPFDSDKVSITHIPSRDKRSKYYRG